MVEMQEMPFRQHEAAHGGGCNGVAFAPSGLHAATCGNDGAVRLWTASDGALATELRAGSSVSGINGVAISEERKVVMGASNDKSIKAWDMHTARLRFTMTGHDKAVLAIAQHPTSPSVAASCGEDRVVRLWSLTDGICRRSIPCRSKPLSVAFSREGDFVASGHFDGSVRVFDAGSGKEVKLFEGKHLKECVLVAPMAHGSRLLSVGKDDAVCVTDIFKPEASKRFAHPDVLHIGQNRCGGAVAPDGSTIAVGASSGLLMLLDAATGALGRKLSCHSNAITGAAWNAQCEDSNVVAATCDRGGGLVFWKAAQQPEG